MSILIVGSVAYDDIITPFASRKYCLGGSAVYFALACHHFDDVHLVGVVGDDFRASDRRLLLEHGIHTEGLVTKPGRTFYWKGEYLANWNDRVTHDTKLNVFEQFDPVLPDAAKQCRFVFLGNIDPVLQGKVLDQVDGKPYVALDTMNYWINNHRANLIKTLKRVDLLVINDSEAMQLSGERHLVDAARTIFEMG
ncbi:MAG: sugar kinase, partial [Acidobacteria bacterium]|nr:sugar kinase [Acidobacteriota bacterium]